MAIELKPLDFGDRIGATFKLYGANFTTLVIIVSVIVIPLQLLSALIVALLARDIPLDPETGLVDPDQIDADLVLAFLATGIVIAVLSFLGTLLGTAGVMKAIVDDTLGGKPDWQDSLRFAFSKIGTLILGSILYALGFIGIVVGSLLAIIVAIALLEGFGAVLAVLIFIGALVASVWLFVSWSIWVPVVLVENRGAAAALGRSDDLVDGRRGPILGYLIVIFIIVGLINAVAGGILGGIASAVSEGVGLALQTVINIALIVLTTPITATAIVVLYFDQRVRNERFGHEDLASDVSASTDDPFGSLPPEPPRAPEEPDDDIPEGFG